MQRNVVRWVAAMLVALAVGAGFLAGGGTPTKVYAGDPTPTPANVNDPGGSGGGH